MLQKDVQRMFELCLTIDPEKKLLVTQQYLNIIEIQADEIQVLEKKVAKEES